MFEKFKDYLKEKNMYLYLSFQYIKIQYERFQNYIMPVKKVIIDNQENKTIQWKMNLLGYNCDDRINKKTFIQYNNSYVFVKCQTVKDIYNYLKNKEFLQYRIINDNIHIMQITLHNYNLSDILNRYIMGNVDVTLEEFLTKFNILMEGECEIKYLMKTPEKILYEHLKIPIENIKDLEIKHNFLNEIFRINENN